MSLNLTYSFTLPAFSILLFIISMYFLCNKQSRSNLFATLPPKISKALEKHKYAPFALSFFYLAILPIFACYIFDSFFAYNQTLLPVIIFMSLCDYRAAVIKEVRASS